MLTGVEGKHTGHKQHDEEDGSCSRGSCGLVPDLVDWDHGRGSKYSVEVADAVEHRNQEWKRSDETNDDGGNKSHWHGSRRVDTILCKMNGAIEARVHEIRIDKPGQEDNSVWPSGCIHEVRPNILAGLFWVRNGQAGNQEDEEA